MSGPGVLLWLALLVPTTVGGEVPAASGGQSSPAAVEVATAPSWERPAPGPLPDRLDAELDAAMPATESKTELEEEPGGSGPEGLAPPAFRPFGPVASPPAPARSRDGLSGDPKRIVTRLRC